MINQINLTSETTTIDGKHLHVTGNTVFDKNVIVSGMIQSGAITADKIDISNGSNKARVEIHNNLIEVYDDNGVLRVRMGVWDE